MKNNEIENFESVLSGRKLLLFAAIIEGVAVIAVELLGAKFIEPYFGSALHTWTSVLGISLLGLSVGYLSGGILSKKYNKVKNLYLIIVIAALLISLMPFVASFVLEFTLFLDIQIGAVISSLILIFPPICLLGMTTPWIIKELSSDKDVSGKTTGWTYALSSIGGIVSAVGLGFFLISALGLRVSTGVVALGLASAPLVYFLQVNNKKFALKLISAVLLIVGLNIYSYLREFPQSEHFTVLHKSAGINGQLMVVDYLKHETRALFVNNISQGLEYRPTGRSQWRYVHRIATYSSFKPEGSKVLLAGLGAGHMVKEFQILGFDIDVCDLDPRMEMVSRNYFNMSDNVNTYFDDFRHFVKTTESKYDIIAIDVSAGENQPNNLYTIEAFQDMKQILNKEGVLFIHYPSAYNKPEGMALKCIGTTLKAAGYNTELINTTNDFEVIQEYVYYASMEGPKLIDHDFSRKDTFAMPYKFPIYENVVFARMKFNKGFVLTDDQPIMDLLHSGIAKSYREQMQPTIKSFLNEGIRFH